MHKYILYTGIYSKVLGKSIKCRYIKILSRVVLQTHKTITQKKFNINILSPRCYRRFQMITEMQKMVKRKKKILPNKNR